MKPLRTLGHLLWLAPLLYSPLSYAKNTCLLANGAGQDAQDITEIQTSCDGLLVEQDSTRIKKEAWSKCCQGADAFIKGRRIPPRADGSAGSPNAEPKADAPWAEYRVKLALQVCDAITPPDLVYEKNLCLTQMLFQIPDSRVAAILDECSPVGHNAGGGKHHHGDTASTPAKPHAPNLLLGDESFSKCQHDKLDALLKRLASGDEATPTSPISGAESSRRHSTSATPRSAQTTE